MDARCPRCSTVFTTDRSGIQFCPNCGQQVDVPDPHARPTPDSWGQPPGGGGSGGGGGFGAGRFTGEPPPGGGAFPGQRELTPWERRKEIGVVHGFMPASADAAPAKTTSIAASPRCIRFGDIVLTPAVVRWSTLLPEAAAPSAPGTSCDDSIGPAGDTS
jgi:hypothetical protein